MLKPLSTVAVAASLLAATLALSMPAQAKDSGALPAASSSAVSARAQTTAPAVKRVRKAQRRVAWVAPPAHYHPQCFLFWCTAGGRSYNLLMLGVAY
jgi:hypothetical protein